MFKDEHMFCQGYYIQAILKTENDVTVHVLIRANDEIINHWEPLNVHTGKYSTLCSNTHNLFLMSHGSFS